MESDHQEQMNQHWRVEGHYPGRISETYEYSYDGKYVENNINQLNVKVMNSTVDNTVICAFADCITSGEVTAVWDSQAPSNEASKQQQHVGFELIYVVKGPCSGIMEDTPFSLASGDCLICNPNIRNLFYNTPDTLVISISMTLQFIRRHFVHEHRTLISPALFQEFIARSLTADTYKGKDYIYCSYKGSDAFNSSAHFLLQTIYTELREKEPGYEQVIVGLLIRLFHSLNHVEEYDIQEDNLLFYSGEELTESIKQYLDAHKRKVTLEELSMYFHYNGNYLSRIFQNKMGQTIREYNTGVCMQEALSLLKETNLSITEISSRIGFASRAQFYKLFEQQYGQKPMTFRPNNRRTTYPGNP